MNVNLFLLEHRVCYIHMNSICSSLEKNCQYSRMSQQRHLLHSSSKTILKKSKIVQIFKSSEKNPPFLMICPLLSRNSSSKAVLLAHQYCPFAMSTVLTLFSIFVVSRYVWIKSKIIYLNAFFDFASVKAPKNNVALTIPRTKETRLIIFDFFSQNLERR